MKTVSVVLVMCLNVGVDPHDVVKTTPCARKECWIGLLLNKFVCFNIIVFIYSCIIYLDPLSQSPQKALENIGNAVQKQYERWQPWVKCL